MTAQHLHKYGKVLRCNRLMVKAQHYKNAGGAVAVRTKKLEASCGPELEPSWARVGMCKCNLV